MLSPSNYSEKSSPLASTYDVLSESLPKWRLGYEMLLVKFESCTRMKKEELAMQCVSSTAQARSRPGISPSRVVLQGRESSNWLKRFFNEIIKKIYRSSMIPSPASLHILPFFVEKLTFYDGLMAACTKSLLICAKKGKSFPITLEAYSQLERQQKTRDFWKVVHVSVLTF